VRFEEGFARSGWIDCGFVNQQNRNVVLYSVYPFAGAALEALGSLSMHERVLACRADQNLEQVLGDHGKHSTLRDEPIHHGDTGARKNWGIV
jgi:hypothetical protein